MNVEKSRTALITDENIKSVINGERYEISDNILISDETYEVFKSVLISDEI